MAYVDRPEPMSPRLRAAADGIHKDTTGPDFSEVLYQAGFRSIIEIDTDVELKSFTARFRGAASSRMTKSLYEKAEMYQDAQLRKAVMAADEHSPQRPFGKQRLLLVATVWSRCKVVHTFGVTKHGKVGARLHSHVGMPVVRVLSLLKGNSPCRRTLHGP